jgi:hypothetical protein
MMASYMVYLILYAGVPLLPPPPPPPLKTIAGCKKNLKNSPRAAQKRHKKKNPSQLLCSQISISMV